MCGETEQNQLRQFEGRGVHVSDQRGKWILVCDCKLTCSVARNGPISANAKSIVLLSELFSYEVMRSVPQQLNHCQRAWDGLEPEQGIEESEDSEGKPNYRLSGPFAAPPSRMSRCSSTQDRQRTDLAQGAFALWGSNTWTPTT